MHRARSLSGWLLFDEAYTYWEEGKIGPEYYDQNRLLQNLLFEDQLKQDYDVT